MTDAFHILENSLKDYMIEAQASGRGSVNAGLYKYNNLRILMDAKKSSTPHFIIRIGISEAMYSLESGEKISGSLGIDEPNVRRWIDRNFSKFNLEFAWKLEKKAKPVIMKSDLDDID